MLTEKYAIKTLKKYQKFYHAKKKTLQLTNDYTEIATIFVFGFGMLGYAFDDVVAIFEVLVNAVNFEFSIFHKTLS